MRHCKALQKVCEETCGEVYWETPPALTIAELAVLLLLAGWKPGAPVRVEQLGGTSCFSVAVEGSKSLGLPELVVCGSLRVEDRAAGISDTVRNLAEKLGDEDFLREMAARLLTALAR